jgi:hypothetical protein
MNNKDLLLEFVDGNLSPEQEETLFFNLSVDDELRKNLRHVLLVEDAAGKNPAVYSPSVHSTRNVFASLGMAIPKDDVIDTTVFDRMITIFRNYSQGIVSSVATAVVLIGLFLLIPGEKSITNVVEKNPGYRGETEAVRHFRRSAIQEIPVVISEDNSKPEKYLANGTNGYGNLEANSKSITREQNQKTFTYPVDENPKHVNLIENSSNIVFKNPLPELVKYGGNTIAYVANSSATEFTVFNYSDDSQPERNSFLKNFNLELTGSNFSYESSFPNNPKDEFINDFSVGLHYDFNRFISAGAEVRRETYYQSFSGIDEFGRKIDYRQQPLLTTFSITGSFRAPLNQFVNPLIRLSAGVNESGWNGRGFAGAEFKPSDELSLIVGFEYSKLFFNHNNLPFESGKYGITYGISYGF